MMLELLLFVLWVVVFLPPLGLSLWRWFTSKEVSAARWVFAGVWAVFGALVLAFVGPHYLRVWTEVLWYREVGFEQFFWAGFWGKWQYFLYAFVPTLLVLWINVRVAAQRNTENIRDQAAWVYWAALAVSVVAAIVAGMAMRGEWLHFRLAEHAVPFGVKDPLYGKDLAFYIFVMPRLEMIRNMLSGVAWVTFILTALAYVAYGVSHADKEYYDDEKAETTKDIFHALTHLSVLGIMLMGVLFFSNRIHIWELLFSTRGTVFGAGWTDIHVMLPALNIFAVSLVIAALLLLVSSLAKSLRVTRNCVIAGFAICFLSWLAFCAIWPGYVQNYRVEPAVLKYEVPFLERNIAFTRLGFGIDNKHIETTEFKPVQNLTSSLAKDNADTLGNVRLWDWSVLQSMNQQNQAFRNYYNFHDVDVVRYRIAGRTAQLMTSLRELDQEALAKTAGINWYNRRLVYTHGYGMCANPVNTFLQPEGLPDYWVRDVPVRSRYAELQIKEPRIYYGELTNQDVFVKTAVPEFDYPNGSHNQTCSYSGTGGVELGSGLRKLAFAFLMDGWRLWKSQELKPDSRVMLHRNIMDRLAKVAPYLGYDRDPYSVVADGKIWFVVDAYTVSGHFPYSEPAGNGINYIRNSVKATIDCYNGTVALYVFESNDPIIQAYQKLFPGVFKPASEMPAALRAHVRYPEDLLTTQAAVLGKYHVSDPAVFYQHEDVWQIANEASAGQPQQVNPYFVNMRFFPGGKGTEFALILPFSPLTTDPQNPRNNMVGWIAGRCDGQEYGKLAVYSFPKGETVQGPAQISARINQDEVISKDLSLWNQQGSHVMFGNLLIVPLSGNRLLYVQPIFLQAASGKMPELKRVVLATGSDHLAYASTFEEALSQLLNAGTSVPGEQAGASRKQDTASVRAASTHMANYQKLTAAGKYGDAGAELQALSRTLDQLLKQEGR